jgi:hypothetical protein
MSTFLETTYDHTPCNNNVRCSIFTVTQKIIFLIMYELITYRTALTNVSVLQNQHLYDAFICTFNTSATVYSLSKRKELNNVTRNKITQILEMLLPPCQNINFILSWLSGIVCSYGDCSLISDYEDFLVFVCGRLGTGHHSSRRQQGYCSQ